MIVRPMTPEDWPVCAEIYGSGIDTGNATFDSSPPNWEQFSATTVEELRLVAVEPQGEIVGVAWALPVSTRQVLRGIVEESLYVHPEHHGKQIGRKLLGELITRSESNNIWTLQAGIFPENVASLALHKSMGFREVGVRERYGFMTFGPFADTWRDVVLLERRSDGI